LRRVSIPSSPNAKRICSGHSPSSGEWTSLVLALFLCGSIASAQLPKSTQRKTPPQRANELTLAGLQPGRDSASRAMQLYKKPNNAGDNDAAQLNWSPTCQKQSLAIDVDTTKKIQVIRTIATEPIDSNCSTVSPGLWRTGRGLRVGDPASKVTQLYGEPDSRSPSSRGGQQLELWYYAFDWAGADVPQVMEVLCTKEKDGKPGQVIEITLAAPSL
jgi:hypothetical protein